MTHPLAKLYYMVESPPCRTVMLVAKMLDIPLEYVRVDLSKQEQKTSKFTEMNPFHVVPTLEQSDGFVLWESRVIAAYLIQEYRPESTLYPVGDLKKRSTIEKFLHYDLGTFYRALSDVVFPIIQEGKPALDKIPRLEQLLGTLDEVLEENVKKTGQTNFIIGNHEISLADISLFFSFTMTEIVDEIDLSKFPHVTAWLELVESSVIKWNDDDWMGEAKRNMRTFADMVKAKALEAEQ